MAQAFTEAKKHHAGVGEFGKLSLQSFQGGGPMPATGAKNLAQYTASGLRNISAENIHHQTANALRTGINGISPEIAGELMNVDALRSGLTGEKRDIIAPIAPPPPENNEESGSGSDS